MTITILLVVLGSSILLSFISYQRARSSLIVQLEDNYQVAAQKYALELTSWVSTNATIIDTMAAEIAVNGISYEDYDTFHNYLKKSNDLLNKNGYVYDVYFTYPNNTMVCASDFIADGSIDFVHEREWYTTSALTGELFFAAPYLDSDTERSIITISKAVYKDGTLLGVLAADIFVDVLVDMINNADVGDNCYAFLIDQNMRMIVHPYSAYAYTDKPLNVMDVAGTPYGQLVESIESGSDGMIFVDDYDGITRGITYSRMTNTGWYVCIATAESVMEQGVSSLVIGFVIATIISIVIGAIVSIILARALDRLNRQEQEYKQEVLRLEKQAADQASEAKSRFLADMSHEIRTPINAIIGMNEMILRESDNTDIRGYSQSIKQSGRTLLQLINSILDFSKIEDGKMEIVPIRYSVRNQISYFINSITDRANAKGLELIFDIDPELPSELYGDDTRINQVVMNLLTNAVKYTERGSVTMSMRRVNTDAAPDQIRILYEVKDTGIGIKEEDMVKLFESFERLDLEKNRNVEGTGLGMAITKKLLELMGSELHVSSVYGSGSTFSFELDQQIVDNAPLGDYHQASGNTTRSGYYHETFHAPDARILVVDDTKMNLLVITNLLKKTGINIDTAISGSDSIDLAGEYKYDVILMDQRMPGMDGTEAMNRIRALDNSLNADTPFICLTADVIKGAREKYIALGFNDYLTKPVEGAELEQMLTDYIPAEKLIRVNEAGEEISVNASSDSAAFLELEKIGVDIYKGIEYSGNDVEIYKEVLSAFAIEEKDRSQCLKEYYSTEDWEGYGIYVHSLKSSAQVLGATKLSELAAESEAAAKDDNEAIIQLNHNTILELYSELAELIKRVLDPNTATGHSPDQEIFEFSAKSD